MTNGPNSYSLLVVEDDPMIMKLICFCLQAEGFELHTALHGLQALEILGSVPVDLIISDIRMPKMDGLTLRRRVMQDDRIKDIPFLFLTSKAEPEEQVEGLSMGVEEYITKPFEPSVMVARVKAVLDRRETYTRLNRTDALTGLLNRRGFEKKVTKELIRIGRYPEVGSLAFLDLDDFKKINDSYGHAAGDEVLSLLAGFIRKTMRALDIAGRYGGEEFVIFLPRTEKNVAVETVQRLLERFRDCKVCTPDLQPTFSAGVAEAPADGVDLETLCARADQAMYQAKRMGKARVIPYTQGDEI